jgi:hypothetical protein
MRNQEATRPVRLRAKEVGRPARAAPLPRKLRANVASLSVDCSRHHWRRRGKLRSADLLIGDRQCSYARTRCERHRMNIAPEHPNRDGTIRSLTPIADRRVSRKTDNAIAGVSYTSFTKPSATRTNEKLRT